MSPAQMKSLLLSKQERVIEIAGVCMLENKEQIIGILVQQQEEEHVDSLNNPLRPYSLPYKKYKELEGKSGQTDFDNTGEFHAEMNLRVDGSEYEFESPSRTDTGVLKSEWLTEWNGSPVMMLTEENKALVAQIIEPSFREKMNSDSLFD